MIDPKQVNAAVARLRSSREEAIVEVRATWMKLECAIVDALAGDALRGLPNLGTSADPFYAARLTGRGKLVPGYEQLVIMRTGRVAIANFHDGRVRWRLPSYQDLRVEMFDVYLKTLAMVLRAHVEQAEKTSRTYEATARLARRIADVVGF